MRLPLPAGAPRIAACLALALLVALPAAAKLKVKELPEKYQQWLAGVELLISKQEREAFLELEKDYQRDAFIERFWRIRDPYPDTARNEFRERWNARVEEALVSFGDLEDDRSRIFLTNGPPDARVPIDCVDLWPSEVWYYQRAESIGSEVAILFYQKLNQGRYVIWYPIEGLRSLMRFPVPVEQLNCKFTEMDAIRAVINMTRALGSMGAASLYSEMQKTRDKPSGEWVATFHAYSTDLPEEASTFPAKVAIDYPSRHQSRTVVQTVISVDRAHAATSALTDHTTYNFVLTGEVLRDDRLFDNFRYKFNLPAAELGEGAIPLVFERYLRPGDYRFVFKLEDLNAKAFFRTERPIAVPEVDYVPPPPTLDAETARLLEEANAAISTGRTTLQIVEPVGELQTGLLRVDTLSTGADIAAVEFLLDGRPVLTKRSPPYSVELDLGSLPRMRTLTAVARDAAGAELARDTKELNAGSHRFDVRLIEPRPGRRYSRSLRAEAKVDVPDGQFVERVEFYLNETLLATLYQPPFTHAILLPSENELAYVRAVAYQPDGNFIEDTVFVNAPAYIENVEVQFVELYIAVLDRNSRPVDDLAQGDFAVLEDGVPQEPRRFDRVTNLPIHAGILLDVSASMDESLETAQRAALEFFQQAIQPRDRAALMTFNDYPNLAVKFTNDHATLAGGLAGLKAERGTALYDSLIFALYYFNGIKGQRALILLSDGKDEHSKFEFEDTLEYARRAGVAIYSIGLNLGRGQLDARRKLTRIAEETGGRSFFVDGADRLAAIYATIQRELRSRYYLAYQSSNTSDSDEFRSIEVKLSRSGLEAKTLRGYYP